MIQMKWSLLFFTIDSKATWITHMDELEAAQTKLVLSWLQGRNSKNNKDLYISLHYWKRASVRLFTICSDAVF